MKINYDKVTGRIKAWGIDSQNFIGDVIIVPDESITEDFRKYSGHQKYEVKDGKIVAVRNWVTTKQLTSPNVNMEQALKDLQDEAEGKFYN